MEKLGTEELRWTPLCTTIHIELYVCMFVACYFETVKVNVNCKCWFYMNCYIDICCNIGNCEWTWNNIYATYLTTNKSSSSVFNTVKEPVPMILECTHSILLHVPSYCNCKRLCFCLCGCVETHNSASKKENQSSALTIYLLHWVVYMAEVQVGTNSCKRAMGP